MTSARLRPAAAPGLSHSVPALSLASLFALLAFAPFGYAQTTPPPVHSTPKITKSSKSAAKSPNVKPGELVALDPNAGTIQIKDKLGKAETYDLTDKTRFMKTKREADASAFKPGDMLVVHIRKARDGGDPQATEVADRESWAWIDGIKHNMTEAVVVTNDDDGLTVAVGPDKIPLSYTVSEKTMWSKGGKEGAASDFKAGDKVYVLPRALPSGAIMARAVTDTPGAGEQMKERQATSVHGVIRSVDAGKFVLTVQTPTNDMRALQGSADTEVVQKSRAVGWPALKPGQNVGARLRRNYAGESVCWKVTIEAKSAKSAKSKTAAKTPSKAVKK